MTQGRLKRWFITPYMVVMIAVLGHILSILWRQGPDLAWSGAALAGLASVGTFAGFILMGKARTRPNLPTLTWGVGLGTILALLGVTSGGSLLALVYAAGVYGLGGWLYVYWYSRFGRQPSERLRPGTLLPDFELIENSGHRLSSGDLRGKPAILLFFRGNWCPLCMAQIKEIAAQYREISARGVEILLISPQSVAHNRALANRFDVPFRYLHDPALNAARALGILHRDALPVGMAPLGYDTDAVLPTVVIIDADGYVRFADETDNYRVRPEPETFLRVLDGFLERTESRPPSP
jgi:peroxiredoxin